MKIIICLKLMLILLCNHQLVAYGEENVYSSTNPKTLRSIFLWETIDFIFPDDNARQEAIENGAFIPGVALLNDIDVANIGKKNQKIFLTFPRYGEGVPATLGYISSNSINNNHNNITNLDKSIVSIVPYPSWERNQVGNCNNLISVYRIKVDECGRLWVLDTGKLVDQICPPKLIKFDLNSDESSEYEFPQDQYKSDSLFLNLEVDVREKCSNTFVYIADVAGYQLVVYDDANKNSWSISHDIFSFHPDHISFTIAGFTFNQTHGIFALALGPLIENGDRVLYFHSLANVVENFVYTSIIRNSTLFETSNGDLLAKKFQSFKKTRSSQAGIEAMDKNGILFSSSVAEAKISCWNTNNGYDFDEYFLENISIVTDQDVGESSTLNLKMISLPDGRDELWMNSVFFVKFNATEIQGKYFKVQAVSIDDLVRGSKCAPINDQFKD